MGGFFYGKSFMFKFCSTFRNEQLKLSMPRRLYQRSLLINRHYQCHHPGKGMSCRFSDFIDFDSIQGYIQDYIQGYIQGYIEGSIVAEKDYPVLSRQLRKLTSTKVQNAEGGNSPYKLFDGGGLFLLVNPNGSRYWRLKYLYKGEEKLLALGVYPEVQLRQARGALRKAKSLLKSGIDPSHLKKVY